MALSFNNEIKNDQLDAIGDAFGGGVIEIYEGTVPANASATHSGTLLAEVDLPATAFAAASGGSMAGAGLPWSDPDAINASGTASFFRMFSSDRSKVIQGTCGVGTGDLQLDTVNLIQGGTFQITGATFSL